MKKVVCKSLLAGAVALLGLSTVARATPTLTLVNSQGSYRITSYNSSNAVTGTASAPITNPYAAPPGPTITPLTGGNGWVLTFTPTSDFMAFASNSGGSFGKTVVMDGKLDFNLTMDQQTGPQKLTVNVYEDGVYAFTGNGTGGVTGGLVVDGLNGSLVAVESHSASLPAETRNGVGGWTDFAQASGFTTSFLTYHISIDNTLLAESLSAQSGGSAYVAKKDFTLIITTDGSTGGGSGAPEPASLGVLATGGLALLARRRRA